MGFIDGVISPSGAGGGGGGVTTYLDYPTLPGSAADGDWASTADDGRTWRYHTIAGLWIPATAYAEGPVVLSHGGDDCAWTPVSDKASLLAASWVEYSWGVATSSFTDGLSGYPELNVSGAINSGHGILWNTAWTGGVGTWTPPASGRYLAIVDWDPIAGVHTESTVCTLYSGYRVGFSGHYGSLGVAGWTPGGAAGGAGAVATVAGVPNFVTYDVSGSNANSSIIVPGQQTIPSVMRSDLSTTLDVQIAFYAMTSGSTTDLSRLSIRRAQVFTL